MDLELIKYILTVLGTLGAAWLAGWWNNKSKEVDASSTPYTALVERVTYLERQQTAFQLWVSLVIPIHADITARWGYHRTQKEPPKFPPFPPG